MSLTVLAAARLSRCADCVNKGLGLLSDLGANVPTELDQRTAMPRPVFAMPQVDVYKGPECDCCGDWMVHMRNNGFKVVAHELPDVGLFRASQGITRALASCHTAIIDGYVIEGHVPAADIRRLLAERPAGARGLTVPGMKHGSPGMKTPFIRPQAYSVLLIRADGSTQLWRSYPGA